MFLLALNHTLSLIKHNMCFIDDVLLLFNPQEVSSFENDKVIRFTISLLRPIDYSFKVELITSSISAFGKSIITPSSEF